MKDYLRKKPDHPAWIKFVIIGLIAIVIGALAYAVNRSRAPADDVKSVYIDQEYRKHVTSTVVMYKRNGWWSRNRGFQPKRLEFVSDRPAVDVFVYDMGSNYAHKLVEFNQRLREGKLPDAKPIYQLEDVSSGKCGFPYRLNAYFMVCFRCDDEVKIDLRIKY